MCATVPGPTTGARVLTGFLRAPGLRRRAGRPLQAREEFWRRSNRRGRALGGTAERVAHETIRCGAALVDHAGVWTRDDGTRCTALPSG